MDAIAGLADRYSFGELRVSHEQNLILADVRSRDLAALWRRSARARAWRRRTSACLTNIICCPAAISGALANAKSIRSRRRSRRDSMTSITCMRSARSI